MATQEDIIDFWFDGVDEKTTLSKETEYSKRWFAKEDSTDQLIKKQFQKDIKKALVGDYDDWKNSASGFLALIILLDQFPRHIYRGSEEAYSYDLKALEHCLRVCKTKMDEELSLYQRIFLYMPLMHSENKELQEMSLMYYRRLIRAAEDTEDPSAPYYQELFHVAQFQYDTIIKFERFPHRNALLDRRPTSEERAFAQQPEISI